LRCVSRAGEKGIGRKEKEAVIKRDWKRRGGGEGDSEGRRG
jgi:hypothetical protein